MRLLKALIMAVMLIYQAAWEFVKLLTNMNVYRDTFHKYILVTAKQLAFFSCLRKHVHQSIRICLHYYSAFNATKDEDLFPRILQERWKHCCSKQPASLVNTCI